MAQILTGAMGLEFDWSELPLEESEVLRQSVGAEALDVARAIRDDIVTISAAGRSVTMSGDQLHVAAEEAR